MRVAIGDSRNLLKRGIGGSEYVYEKQVDSIKLGHLVVTKFRIQIGAMNYGFKIRAIIGTDFFLDSQAIIDMKEMRIY